MIVWVIVLFYVMECIAGPAIEPDDIVIQYPAEKQLLKILQFKSTYSMPCVVSYPIRDSEVVQLLWMHNGLKMEVREFDLNFEYLESDYPWEQKTSIEKKSEGVKQIASVLHVKADKESEGAYWCQIIYAGVKKSSYKYRMITTGPPKFIERPSDMSVRPGEAFQLKCSAQGPPEVTSYLWTVTDLVTKIKNEGDLNIVRFRSAPNDFSTDDRGIIGETLKMEFGVQNKTKITCQAFNKNDGESKIHAIINIKVIADIPSKLKVTNETDSSVYISWLRGSDGHANDLKWNYELWITESRGVHRVQFNRSWDTGVIPWIVDEEQPNGRFAHRFLHLKPYSSYKLRLNARNEMGVSNWSEWNSFATLEGVPTDSVTGLKVAPHNRTHYLVSFDPLREELFNGDLKGYKVRVALIENDTDNVITLTTTKAFIEMAHDQRYKVQVAGYTRAGVGSWSKAFIVYKGKVEEEEDGFLRPGGNDKQQTFFTSNLHYIIPSIVGGILFAFLAGCLFMYCSKRRNGKHALILKASKSYRRGRSREMTVLSVGNDMAVALETLELSDTLKENLESVLIDRSLIELGRKLGEGEFGCVVEGHLRRGTETSVVAVKTIKNITSRQELLQFICEGIVMKDFRHPNVLSLIGVCLEEDRASNLVKPLVILPFMKHGDVHTYLAHIRNGDIKEYVPVQKLIEFCIQIAEGMAYLSEHNFVHRDIAARNCMLDDNFIVHVADFGLSRKIYAENYYRQGSTAKVPVKWLAIESLVDRIYTTQSDVWSFGVTMWEITTLGQQPYPGVANHEVYDFLQRGIRLRQPLNCPDSLYSLMCSCWLVNPLKRPRFSALSALLNEILRNLGPPPPPSQNYLYENNDRATVVSLHESPSTGSSEESMEALPVEARSWEESVAISRFGPAMCHSPRRFSPNLSGETESPRVPVKLGRSGFVADLVPVFRKRLSPPGDEESFGSSSGVGVSAPESGTDSAEGVALLPGDSAKLLHQPRSNCAINRPSTKVLYASNETTV